MATATMTTKGQITLPAEVRRDLDLRPGSRVDFVRMEGGTYELVPATSSVTSLKGAVPAPAEPVSLERMDEAIADAARYGA